MGTPAAVALAAYRERLVGILTSIESADSPGPRVLHIAVAQLLENLSHNLAHLYLQRGSPELSDTDQAIVIPALERMRDVLRHRRRPSNRLSDTLHEAIAAYPACPP
jgi:hypothetical protein